VIKAVLFDMGGVLVSSPFDGFARYERAAGLPAGTVRSINATDPDANAWARYERGEIDRTEFVARFEAEAAARGHRVDAHQVLAALVGQPIEAMIGALERVRAVAATALLTNNLHPHDPEAPVPRLLLPHFDVVVQSSVEGVRKPDPAFYRLACDRLEVVPSACVFLDDLGVNLKPARSIGMHTIKVVDPDAALDELAVVLGVPLR
jgi:putative hydrolase of the HAD superfamily